MQTENQQNNKLDRPITSGFLLKFSAPTIISMILMSFFGIIDGVFASRLIGPISLSAVGIVFPMLTFIMSIGFMLGVGGNALVAKQIGEEDIEGAKKNFNLIIILSFSSAVALSILGVVFTRPILYLLGANQYILEMAIDYATPLFYTIPFIMMGVIFNQFLMTEGKAHFSTIGTAVGGVLNVILNYVFIYTLQMGLTGAALATSAGYAVPTLIGLFYFATNKKGHLRFGKTNWHKKSVVQSVTNGASEMVTMLSVAIVSAYMNNIAVNLGGEIAVASLTIAFALMNITGSLFMGFSAGIGPIISYNYGKNDEEALQKLFKKSLYIVGFISIISFGLGFVLARPLTRIYVEPDNIVYYTTIYGFRLLIAGFIFMGFNTFSSMFFTALNNGKISAILSFCRTLVFSIISMTILPIFIGMDGVWLALPVAEAMAIVLTIYIFNRYKTTYKYA